jgi:hypothetical protein
MNSNRTNPDKFRDSLSLRPIAKALANALLDTDTFKEIRKKKAKYCLGVHVRQLFDTASPTVFVVSSNAKNAGKIQAENEGRGNQTLNHVLDALLGTRKKKANEVLAAFVTVDFKAEKATDCEHPFDCDSPEELKAPREAFKHEISSFGVQEEICVARCHLPTILPELQKTLNPMEYYCGSTKFCDHLKIQITPLALTSVWRAVIQLGQYAGADNFGNHTATFLLRGDNPFGFVVGFTLITEHQDFLKPAALKPCFKLAHDFYQHLNKPKCALPLSSQTPESEIILNLIEHYKGMLYGETDKSLLIPDELAQLIRNDTTINCLGDKQNKFEFVHKPEGILASIKTFIKLAARFCDESIEGRQLRFGLVHGNPFLMFHWDGPSPIPLAKDRKFIPFGNLPQQFHLIEDPEDRCLVIPHLPPQKDPSNPKGGEPNGEKVNADAPIPGFVLELRHFKEAFSESAETQLWSEEFRPYAYFSGRHHWAVACVVGPFSEMRIFTRGSLTAYRDGKGWKMLRKPSGEAKDPWDEIADECKQWRKPEKKAVLKVLIKIAIQLSPVANRHAKGGLILFAPRETESKEGKTWFAKFSEDYLQELSAVEPDNLPHEHGLRWLTDRPILKDNNMPDEEVTHRLLRACSQDGAAIICGSKAVVKAFAKRVNPPPIVNPKEDPLYDPDEKSSGTKHYTATAFVNMITKSLSGEQRKLGLGIAVSSGGKITITTVKAQGRKLVKHKTELFKLYEETNQSSMARK